MATSKMAVDNDLRRIVRDLGHALIHAMAASPQAADTVRKIQREGYSLFLVLDRKEGEGRTRIELTSDRTAAAKPGFRLNQGDVSFLESVGIDATRPGRRRRTP